MSSSHPLILSLCSSSLPRQRKRTWQRELTKALLLPPLLLSGCVMITPYPLNVTEEEWPRLNTEQQTQTTEKQRELNQAKSRANEARQNESYAWSRLEPARQRRDFLKLEVRRHEARYGERVLCWLEQGLVQRDKEWYALNPVAIDLVTEFTIHFDLTEKKHAYRYGAYGEFDGDSVRLCLNSYTCTSVSGSITDYRHGLYRDIKVGKVRGQLMCRFIVGDGPHN